MRTLICPDEATAIHAAATLIAETAAAIAEPVLALPTGRTMIPLYDALAQRHARGTIDLTRARGHNLDELLLPAEHPATFRAYMARHVWDRTGLREERCDMPRHHALPLAECRRYDAALAAAGGLDLAILGVGADGHVAYNLPGPPVPGTHLVTLPNALADTLAVPTEARPLRAITMGLGVLLAAKHLLLLALSAEKAIAIRQLVLGPADELWPCSLLRDHPRLDIVLSPAAAALLPGRPF
jgi:glucosamine-6-phosphate deaminase